MKHIHVPLPEDLYETLRREARRSRRPATQIAREAIRRLLEERRRRETEQALEDYVREKAGSRDDLDPALERAAVEHLRNLDRPRRRRS